MDRNEQKSILPGYTQDINPLPGAGAQVAKSILLIGVGGMGCKVVDYMHANQLPHVEYCAIHTDVQDLKELSLPSKFGAGEQITVGLGAGADAGIGRKALYQDEERIHAYLENVLARQGGYQIEVVYIVGALGGGTALVAIPALSQLCAQHDLPTVVVYATPSCDPDDRVCSQARNAIGQIEKWANGIMLINSAKLMRTFGDLPLQEYHEQVDKLVASSLHAVVGIGKGTFKGNLDLNDARMMLGGDGQTGSPIILASGEGRGPNRIEEAVKSVINSPMLQSNGICGAGRILFQLLYAKDSEHVLATVDFAQLKRLLRQATGAQVDFVFGGGPTGEITDDAVRLTIIASGFDGDTTPLALFEQVITSADHD